jgi:FAD synthase
LERPDSRKLLPPAGVYAVRVAVVGAGAHAREQDGVANLGTRPTFGGGETVLEVHLLDGEHDLYDRTIRVSFVARVRGERRFESAAHLREQIGRDVVEARRLL